MLEPYAGSRDVSYVVVAPENDFVLSTAKTFFTELTTTYETCRLGSHRPLTDKLRDGILRVSRKKLDTASSTSSSSQHPRNKLSTTTTGSSSSNNYSSSDNENAPNSAFPSSSPSSSSSSSKWFDLIGDSDLASKLRLYAKICCQLLAPFLVKTLLASSCAENDADRTGNLDGAATPCPPPPSPRDAQPENGSNNIPGKRSCVAISCVGLNNGWGRKKYCLGRYVIEFSLFPFPACKLQAKSYHYTCRGVNL